jgi:hypothetical protein
MTLMRLVCSILLALAGLSASCARTTYETRTFETTAYCDCGECNGYSRGNLIFLKLDFWNRYVDYGSRKGQKYTGRTASGNVLTNPDPGLFAKESLAHPWMIPIRIVFFPWMLKRDYGTIAADTDYYRFGTKMHIPGWGWGSVEDRGGAIKGPNRLDLFFNTHRGCNKWGRRQVKVEIVRPD